MLKLPYAKKLVKPNEPELAEKHTAHEKLIREYHMGEHMKTLRVHEGNLCNHLAVSISQCDSEIKTRLRVVLTLWI